MPHHAASTPHGAWFHPTVRDGRRPAPRTVPAIVPSRGLAAALPAETVAVPRLSWLARLDRWCWSLEQKRIDDYLAAIMMERATTMPELQPLLAQAVALLRAVRSRAVAEAFAARFIVDPGA